MQILILLLHLFCLSCFYLAMPPPLSQSLLLLLPLLLPLSPFMPPPAMPADIDIDCIAAAAAAAASATLPVARLVPASSCVKGSKWVKVSQQLVAFWKMHAKRKVTSSHKLGHDIDDAYRTYVHMYACSYAMCVAGLSSNAFQGPFNWCEGRGLESSVPRTFPPPIRGWWRVLGCFKVNLYANYVCHVVWFKLRPSNSCLVGGGWVVLDFEKGFDAKCVALGNV